MRLFDAGPQIVQDLKDESEVIAVKEHSRFKVSAVRHPTMGKVVIVEAKHGEGIIVEMEE
ncbi:hypothetical protein [Candidatus Thiosymbion oneisti]|uniref:hypothetical protein n=1 Tax=Candidatus Thiosymbion oneisti TaxID=589554 RepID=UPI000B7FD8D8|nr:hypothetical protein [Candidatus Thiosymbion oneisti]